MTCYVETDWMSESTVRACSAEEEEEEAEGKSWIATYAYAREQDACYGVLKEEMGVRSWMGASGEVYVCTSSPMTARNCRSLYADEGRAMVVVV